jgi:hypothetical protein
MSRNASACCSGGAAGKDRVDSRAPGSRSQCSWCTGPELLRQWGLRLQMHHQQPACCHKRVLPHYCMLIPWPADSCCGFQGKDCERTPLQMRQLYHGVCMHCDKRRCVTRVVLNDQRYFQPVPAGRSYRCFVDRMIARAMLHKLGWQNAGMMQAMCSARLEVGHQHIVHTSWLKWHPSWWLVRTHRYIACVGAHMSCVDAEQVHCHKRDPTQQPRPLHPSPSLDCISLCNWL